MLYTVQDLAYYIERLIRPYDATSEINELYISLKLNQIPEESSLSLCDYYYGNALYSFYQGNHEKATEYFLLLADESETKEPSLYVRSQIHLGIINYLNSGSTQLLDHFTEYMGILKPIKDYEGMVSLIFGTLYYFNDTLSELRMYELLAKCVAYTKLCKSRRSIIFQLQLGAYSKNVLKDPISALVYYKDVMQFSKQFNDSKVEIYTELEIARCYYDLRRYQQTISIVKEAMQDEHYSELRDKARFNAEIMLYSCCLEMHYYEEAKIQIDKIKGSTYVEEGAKNYLEASLLSAQAEYAIHTNQQLKEATTWIEKALQLYQDYSEEFISDSFKQNLLLCAGDLSFKKKDYQYALHFYKQIVSLSTSTFWNKKDAFERLAITYEALGDFVKSKDMYNKALCVNNEINKINNTKRYNLNFDQFLASNDTFFTQLRQDENIILEEYLDEESLVYNEKLLENYIKFHNETVLRKEVELSVVMISINEYDEYKAFYGEELAAILLKTLAKTMQHTFGDLTTKIVHINTSEFYILVNDCKKEDVTDTIERLLLNIERLAIINEVNPNNEFITVKIGYSTMSSKVISDYTTLLEKASVALHSLESSTSVIAFQD